MPTTVKIRRSGTASATPSALEHGEIAINYADGKVFWKNASNVITSFTFQSYALASHTHSISDVTGLQTALDGKASSSHTHSISDVTGLQTALDGKASSSHTHAASDITSGTLDIARIANDAVTYAKIQNVSATNRILGRSSAGAGDVEELDAATARTVMSVQPTASPAFTGAATFANTGDVVPLTVTNAGTANSFVVNDASGDTTPFVIDASGNVGIGVSSPTHKIDCGGEFRLRGTGPSSEAGKLHLYYVSDTNRATITTGSSGEIIVETGASSPATRLTISSTGTATFAGQVLVTAGSGSSGSYKPGLAISGDDDTGIHQVSGNANTLSIVTNGTERVRVDASGYVIIPKSGSGTTGPELVLRNTASLATSNACRISFLTDSGASVGGTPNGAIDCINTGGGGASSLAFSTWNGSAIGERVRIDATGNVGIGGSPSAKLDLLGGVGVKMYTYRDANANAGIGTDLSGAAYECSIFAGGTADTHGRISFGRRRVDTGTYTERMSIDSAGTVVAPQVYADTVGATNRDLFVDSTGKLGYVSSIRESKTDIVTLDDVSWLSALSPVSYRYRKRNPDGTYSDEADGVTDYGLIAEDVEAVKPELCFYDDVDGEAQLRGVTYSKLITPMLRYIQQLEARIAALEERLNG
jgi:hypothetical protein